MTIILERDDWIPLLASAGVAATLETVAKYLPTITELRTDLNRFCLDNGIEMQGFSETQIQQLVADLRGAGMLVGSKIAEGSNVKATDPARAAAPSDVGITSENVWVTPPGETYTLRFYVNGTLEKTLSSYYITSLASLGAESGDTIQICQVVEGVVGWMTSAAVP